MSSLFKQAKREQIKASIVIQGLSGYGKTGAALIIADALAKHEQNKIALIDTENKSSLLYEGIEGSHGKKFKDFFTADLTPEDEYKPSHYDALRQEAIKEGFEVIINDSLSHAWSYKGGVLDIVNKVQATSKDKYAAWADPEVMAEKQKLQDLMRSSKIHVISTMRVKERMEYIEGEGKTKLVSMGEQQIMQADMKYEPDLNIEMIQPGKVRGKLKIHPKFRVIKSRYAILDEGEEYDLTPELANDIASYLNEGEDADVIRAQQLKDNIEYVKEYLDNNPKQVKIWETIKKQEGLEDVKLSDIDDLDILKKMFNRLTT